MVDKIKHQKSHPDKRQIETRSHKSRPNAVRGGKKRYK